MTTLETIKSTLSSLNLLSVPYMITGAYAVSYYGRPRATHDIDIVVELDVSSVTKTIKTFRREFDFDGELLHSAVLYRTHFAMIHIESGFRVEFWIVKNKPFEKKKLERRQKIKLFGISTYMISAEDIILTKLEWFKRSKNQKHRDDVLGILDVQGKILDLKYISKMTKELGVEDFWKKLSE